MSPRLRSALTAALAVALIVVAGACDERGDAGVEPITRSETDTTSGGDSEIALDAPQTVAMIGDSITFLAGEALQATLAGTGLEVLTIDAQVGRRITVGEGGQPHAGTEIVEFIANGVPPDVWVIALGTNDIGQYPDAVEFATQVQTLLDLLPTGAPLAWVDTWDGQRPEETQLVNDTLRLLLGGREHTIVVDWSSRADDDGIVSGDGVHPTDAGTLVFSEVVAGGVEDLLASL